MKSKRQSISAIPFALSLSVFGAFDSMPVSAQTTMQNKDIIQKGFEAWGKGEGSFFDLLTEDVQWTIIGSTPQSKTYTSKKEFMEAVIIPLNERLSKKIIPSIRAIFGDGNTVIALWDGTATANDGKSYNMSYSWYMQMNEGRIVNVVAFLDGIQFKDIMARVKGTE